MEVLLESFRCLFRLLLSFFQRSLLSFQDVTRLRDLLQVVFTSQRPQLLMVGGRQKYVRGGENSEKHGDLVGMSHFKVRKLRLVSALLQRRGLILSFCTTATQTPSGTLNVMHQENIRF